MAIKTLNTLLTMKPKDSDKGNDKGNDKGKDKGNEPEGTPGNPQPGDDQGGDTKGDQDGEGGTTKENNPTDKKGGNGAGGKDTSKEKPFGDLINQIKNDLENGQGSELLDNNTAMDEAVKDMIKELYDACDPGEKPYIYGDTSKDEIRIVRENDATKSTAQTLLDQVRDQSNFLRASLRQMVRAMEFSHTTHGLKRGRGLSARTLVDTALSVRAGIQPKRAYYDTDTVIDTSIACAICLDESGSMDDSLVEASKMLLALAEPIDSIGGKVLAYGFRDGRQWVDGGQGHREDCSMIYDVFKSWEERFVTVKGRFANTIATGGTPMAEGIQFGLDNLELRTEKHRILFVLTDGEPNYGHRPVIKRQIRVAKEAGIHIVGIGWGYYGRGVQTLYPDHCWADSEAEIPKLLVAKLRSLLKEKVGRRGQRVAK